jgi:hypothetical protein
MGSGLDRNRTESRGTDARLGAKRVEEAGASGGHSQSGPRMEIDQFVERLRPTFKFPDVRESLVILTGFRNRVPGPSRHMTLLGRVSTRSNKACSVTMRAK